MAKKKAAQPASYAKARGKVLSNAEAAALVKRTVPVMKGGKPTGDTRQVPVSANEVLSFADYGDHVMVVTTDGKKLRGEK
ncbi:MAG: hypothetical protein JMN25_15755 [gamma proteobacterium endosymbiont of Lamellibrachia anaximandri]|nr:hypothetical protein [gamma proteobacterium endosymbiont of Lamellibrachia anaximandri]